jgi:hypothetical protein
MALYNDELSTVYDIKKHDQLRSLMAPSESVKGPFKQDIGTSEIAATGQGVV